MRSPLTIHMTEDRGREETALSALLEENERLKRELSSAKEESERLQKDMISLYYQHRSTQMNLQLLSNELLMQSQSHTPSLATCLIAVARSFIICPFTFLTISS